jgi:arsenate reductase
MSRPRLVFLCVANSARSQMAEALARARYGERVMVESAGTTPSRVSDYATFVMRERGLDVSAQRSKSVDTIDPVGVSIVVTLCAEEVCPAVLSAATRLHWPIADPASSDPSLDRATMIVRFAAAASEIERRLPELDVWLSRR